MNKLNATPFTNNFMHNWFSFTRALVKKRFRYIFYIYAILKEKDRKQLNRNQNENISKTKLFSANFMKIGL